MVVDDETYAGILADCAAGETINRSLAARGIDKKSWYLHVRDPVRAAEYAAAKIAGLSREFDEMCEIADGTDGQEPTRPGRRRRDTMVRVSRDRLRVDTRKWALVKLLPRVFGERTILAGDPEAPLAHAHAITAVRGRLLPELVADRAPSEALGFDGR